jgi:hypothetical protein
MNRPLTLAIAALGLLGSAAPAVTSTASSAASSSLTRSVTSPAPTSSATQVHLSEAHALAAGTAAPRAGTMYSFSSMLEGKPVRWNPCTPIHWKFRAPGAPAGGITVVKQAVARVAQATGTSWVFDGTVSTAPSTSWLPTSTDTIKPVLIGWADAASSDLLRGQARNVLGVTRTAWFGAQQNGHSLAVIRAAVIALDRTDKLPLNGSVSWKAVALHEISHAMGLDHAGNSRQLMYPVLQAGIADLQSGDLAGLSRVGRAAGCVVVPS